MQSIESKIERANAFSLGS